MACVVPSRTGRARALGASGETAAELAASKCSLLSVSYIIYPNAHHLPQLVVARDRTTAAPETAKKVPAKAHPSPTAPMGSAAVRTCGTHVRPSLDRAVAETGTVAAP